MGKEGNMKLARTFAMTAVLVLGALPQTNVSSHAQNAPSPEALRAAQELVAITSADSTAGMVANLTAQIWPSAEAALREQYPNIDAATTEELRKEFERIVVASVNDVMKDAPAIYVRHLTAQEMRDAIAFYKTPSGAKTLRVMPQLTAEIAAAIDPRTQGLQERINLAFLNILQKRGLYAQ